MTCEDCLQPHGRHHRLARLCLSCKRLRRLKRNRSESYRAMQARWNASAKAKVVKGRYYEKNRHRNEERAKLRRALQPKKQIKCASLLCEGTFIRPKASRRLFCTECQVIYYGASYLRKMQNRPWKKAA